jgi:hypothetical protein
MLLLALYTISIVYVCVFILEWHIWPISFLLFYAFLRYMTNSEITGESRLPKLRSLAAWNSLSPCKYYFNDEASVTSARVFIFFSRGTLQSMFWAMGAHARMAQVHWVWPVRQHFWIPGVRELLLWMGAISQEGIEDALYQNRPICVPFTLNLTDILSRVCQQRLTICLVVVQHEPARYMIHPWWGTFYNLFAPKKPPMLSVTFSNPFTPPENYSVEQLSQYIDGRVSQLSKVIASDHPYEFKPVIN